MAAVERAAGSRSVAGDVSRVRLTFNQRRTAWTHAPKSAVCRDEPSEAERERRTERDGLTWTAPHPLGVARPPQLSDNAPCAFGPSIQSLDEDTLTRTRFTVRRRILVAFALTISASALSAQQGSPPSRAARISALTGQVSLQPSGATDWSEAALNYTVTTGDRIYSAAGSRLELEIGAMSVRIADLSDVTVTNLSDGFMQLGIEQGTVRLSVYRLPRGDSIEVDTPNGAVMVTTPGSYLIDIPDNDNFTVVSVDDGSVEIVGPGVDQIVRRGQAVQLSGTDDIRAVSMARPGLTPFDRWAADRDARVGSAGCSRYMSRDIPGCADLDDNGRWESNAQYGAVWYPANVSAGWVPYRDGRWVWIDPWGWSWVDDAPWGYAPFHYGRWSQFGNSWGWIPGPIDVRPYYAPALVAFVGGSGWSVGVSIGTQAWFPLGPREAYIPAYHHDDAYLRQVNISNVRNVTNINTIINVQDVNRVTYVNRTRGITAVPTDAFRRGDPVSKTAVKVTPEIAGRGSIISHPLATPVARAALGGRPAAVAPPAAPRPPMVTTASPRNVAPGQARSALPRGQPKPTAASAQAPPQRTVPQQPAPQQPQRTQPQNAAPQQPQQRGRPAAVPAVKTETPPPSAATPPVQPQPRPAAAPQAQPRPGRPIITRAPPPPQAPSFQAKEPALQAHPGKPLEPQQTQNVRAGRPAGPAKDPENANHQVVVPPSRPVQPPAAAPVKPAPPPAAGGKPAPGGRGGKPDSTSRGGTKKPGAV